MYQTTAAAQTSSSTGPVAAGQQASGSSAPDPLQGGQAVAQAGGRTAPDPLQGGQAVAQAGGRTDHPQPH
eukprot:2645644-Prymnesium_polylepis.1